MKQIDESYYSFNVINIKRKVILKKIACKDKCEKAFGNLRIIMTSKEVFAFALIFILIV